MLERVLSRRKFLGLLGSELLISACSEIEDKEQRAFPDLREKFPIDGDVISFGNKHFLLRDNFAYEIPDFSRYKKLTKFEKYGGRIFRTDSIPRVYQTKSIDLKMGGVVDYFSGSWKDAKLYGGEINVFFPGFLTDGGDIQELINSSNETFLDITDSLKTKNWELMDNEFFSYDAKRLEEYKTTATIKNPLENIENALKFFDKLKKDFPLARFNLISHSLGGVFAIEVAKKNQGCINNLIILDSPVNGIKKNDSTSKKAEVLKNLLRPFVGEEQVTEYLFDRWDKNLKVENEEFARSFIGSGKRIFITASNYDLDVPLEAKLIEGAKQMILKNSPESPALGYAYFHGLSLKNKDVIKVILDIIGENESRNL